MVAIGTGRSQVDFSPKYSVVCVSVQCAVVSRWVRGKFSNSCFSLQEVVDKVKRRI